MCVCRPIHDCAPAGVRALLIYGYTYWYTARRTRSTIPLYKSRYWYVSLEDCKTLVDRAVGMAVVDWNLFALLVGTYLELALTVCCPQQ